MHQLKEGDSAVVGDHGSGEAPGISEQVGQQRRIRGDWNAVDVGVGVHHAAHVAHPDRVLERRQDVVSELPRTDADRRVVSSRLRCRIAGEVLERSQ